MITNISFLRGINVGGKNKIQMEGLKALYESLKFKDIITYIQSGNIIFKSDDNIMANDISILIENAIFEEYKFKVSVIIRSLDAISRIKKSNPFLIENGINMEKLHVTFLSQKPEQAKLESIKNLNFFPDRFAIIEKEVYLYCPVGYGISKLSNNFFENKLKVNATTRNWNTVNKLVELGRDN